MNNWLMLIKSLRCDLSDLVSALTLRISQFVVQLHDSDLLQLYLLLHLLPETNHLLHTHTHISESTKDTDWETNSGFKCFGPPPKRKVEYCLLIKSSWTICDQLLFAVNLFIQTVFDCDTEETLKKKFLNKVLQEETFTLNLNIYYSTAALMKKNSELLLLWDACSNVSD